MAHTPLPPGLAVPALPMSKPHSQRGRKRRAQQLATMDVRRRSLRPLPAAPSPAGAEQVPAWAWQGSSGPRATESPMRPEPVLWATVRPHLGHTAKGGNGPGAEVSFLCASLPGSKREREKAAAVLGFYLQSPQTLAIRLMPLPWDLHIVGVLCCPQVYRDGEPGFWEGCMRPEGGHCPSEVQ